MPGLDAGPAGSGQDGAPSTESKDKGNTMAADPDGYPELDDFGLPIRKFVAVEQAQPLSDPDPESTEKEKGSTSDCSDPTAQVGDAQKKANAAADKHANGTDATSTTNATVKDAVFDSEEDFKDAVSTVQSVAGSRVDDDGTADRQLPPSKSDLAANAPTSTTDQKPQLFEASPTPAPEPKPQPSAQTSSPLPETQAEKQPVVEDQAIAEASKDQHPVAGHSRQVSTATVVEGPPQGPSEFSHQQLINAKDTADKKIEDDEGEWQEMPAFAPYDIYDDDNRLIAREHNEAEDETYGYAGLGGAGKGYTRVLVDDDAESATSMDENTQYLFKEAPGTNITEDDDAQRDAVSQLQATKELLTEGQRIAYVGLTRLELAEMLKEVEAVTLTKGRTKKELTIATENMKMWSQKMMIRLYTHMDISPAEQVMIEQLSSHGVQPQDLTPVLMANARVKNPMAAEADRKTSVSDAKSPRPPSTESLETEQVAEPPPPYEADNNTELTAPVRTPSQMATTQKIDIDLRWTVLCDLFLVLIADSIYDARSRVLLERVGKDLEIPWLDICKFERKVTDALEMQQNAEKENWNEDDHKENRRKLALRRRYVMMGLATVGGGLVIGLSAGLLAPMIGAGLAAGFGVIGVGGTAPFLAGAGGAAIITSTAAASGSVIGVRAANRRTGAVKTFEYRPLHNNKRVNLIVTVSGWMTGKVDDVRLPFSTVDPVMGDIYSVLWEPEMLRSMGDTINILATEALTSGLQQVLGATILFGLMSAIQLPVVLTKLSYLIDNPWTVSLDRATMAGLILADSLIDRNLGTRPVTLVGYSLGSRVIFSCLMELSKKGAYGLVQNVYLFGSPIVVNQDEYRRARSVVSGRFVNGYNRNDWILGYLFRLTSGGIRRIAGLAAVDGIPGVENMDTSDIVVGHMNYRTAMPKLLRECGWMVESDEFAEIEDPDPDNHQERQRELINEIEEARKEFEKENKNGEKKGRFSFFKKKKLPQRQEWEVYEDINKDKKSGSGGGGGGATEDKDGNNHGVLFDVDAIRAELAKEHAKNGTNSYDNGDRVDEELLQVKEIKSTLPPMKLDLNSSSPSPAPSGSSFGFPPPAAAVRSSRDSLRETKSAGTVPSYRSSAEQNKRAPTFPASRIETDHHYSSYDGHSSSGGGGLWSNNSRGGGGIYGGGQYDDDDGIQMTFDTEFDDKDRRKARSTTALDTTATASASSIPTTHNKVTRPEMKTAQTVPNIAPAANPWADYDDYDDDDFGKEKEISMTFA